MVFDQAEDHKPSTRGGARTSNFLVVFDCGAVNRPRAVPVDTRGTSTAYFTPSCFQEGACCS